MRKTIHLSLNSRSFQELYKELDALKADLAIKQERLIEKLADRGIQVMRTALSNHIYTGETIDSIEVDVETNGTRTVGAISVGGRAIMFLEFGAGLVGYGHPRAGEFGLGPGTYPGTGHWNKPGGWWYPTNDPALAIQTDKYGQMWAFSRGQRPLQPVHQATEYMKRVVAEVAKEVFSG